MITRVSCKDENDKVEFRLDNSGKLIIEIEGEQKRTITIDENNTNILRLMLYDKYKSRKMPKSERSAQNKISWAIARSQGKKKPGEKIACFREYTDEVIKEYDEVEMDQLMESLDEHLDEAMKHLRY